MDTSSSTLTEPEALNPAVAGIICPLCRRVKAALSGRIMLASDRIDATAPYKVCSDCVFNIMAKIKGVD